jgi:hypothetical protein
LVDSLLLLGALLVLELDPPPPDQLLPCDALSPPDPPDHPPPE